MLPKSDFSQTVRPRGSVFYFPQLHHHRHGEAGYKASQPGETPILESERKKRMATWVYRERGWQFATRHAQLVLYLPKKQTKKQGVLWKMEKQRLQNEDFVFFLQERLFLSASNYIFTVIFLIEMAIKVSITLKSNSLDNL